MDEVVDELFVGTLEDAGNTTLIREHSIVNVVSLTHSEPNGGFSSDLTVENIPMKDGPRNDQQKFNRAVTNVLSCLKTGENLLVHCTAGASRSPAVAATALALYDEIRLEAAFEQVSNQRTAVDPHQAVVRQAARVYTQHRK
jgi:protein-tyrosine phosphatase